LRAWASPFARCCAKKCTPYAVLGLGDPNLTDEQLLDAVMAHTILINRPIVVTPKGVRLCRPFGTGARSAGRRSWASSSRKTARRVVDEHGRRVATA